MGRQEVPRASGKAVWTWPPVVAGAGREFAESAMMVIFSQPSHWTSPPQGPHYASTNVHDDEADVLAAR